MKRLAAELLLLGEESKETVSDKKGAKLAAQSCLWCEKPVWISQFGYTENNPVSDIAIEKIVDDPKKVKALHKYCLAEIMDFSQEVAIAMGKNLRARGEL